MTYYFSFQVLGVDKSASQRDIQKAFHKYVLLTSYVNEIQLLRCFSVTSLQTRVDGSQWVVKEMAEHFPSLLVETLVLVEIHLVLALAHDVSHPMLKRLGVKKLPSVVGKLVTGEMHVLRSGIIVKDLKSGIEELRTLLENFEKKNKVSSDHSKKPSQNEEAGNVPFLTAWNIDNLCGEKAIVCFIGAFRSSKGRDQLGKIVSEVSKSCYTFAVV
ncbi:hypothetical protein B296_00033980 [Ensete ventricosum]|uniref:Uncharacterized protein n=1 Tax=Ensete ventricosum TaxID=4639 RepID=A0A426XVB3_ENSVE|nr:hypothetical protein B296_00033980 [Ensete ventricosum]